MAEDLLDTKTFWDGVKKVGPGSEFRYRCIFDPTPVTREQSFPPANADESK